MALACMGDIQQKKAERHAKLAQMHLSRGDKANAALDQEQAAHQSNAAREWYTRAVGMDPCNSWALAQLAHLHLSTREHAAAEELYKQVSPVLEG